MPQPWARGAGSGALARRRRPGARAPLDRLVRRAVPQDVVASVMAFGSGVLISAVAFDLMAGGGRRPAGCPRRRPASSPAR